MINARGIWLTLFAILVLILLAANARAADVPEPVSAYCQQIKEVVSSIGEKDAEKAARAAGATEQQINEAKRCLHRH